jgi:cytochrome d ubiquinol oxidase subunit I
MWLVAIGSNVSALWILIANSFMQEPVGYVINEELGRVEMTNFLDLILNPSVGVQFPHTVMAGFATAAFFVMGISAYHLIRKNQMEVFRPSFRIAAIVGSIAIVLVILNGHSQGQHMVETQPMKMAAAEALWNTESPASFSLLTIGDMSQRREIFSIRIPRLLCILSFTKWDCEVKGVYNLQAAFEQKYGPGDYIPPVAVVYWAFRIMVGSGFLMAALALYALFMVIREMTEDRPRLLRFFQWAIILPYLANSAGWIMTEMGRVPWVVYGLMKIEQAVSNVVPAGQVLATLILYTLIYAALMVATLYLLVKYAKAGPATGEEVPLAPDEPAPSLVGPQDLGSQGIGQD